MGFAFYRCACEFAKIVNDNDPTHYPRVGMVDNVLYRGSWLIQHSITGKQAAISRPGEGPLCAEAAPCCFDYFAAPTTGDTHE